jgi:hypothetical protein
VNTRSLWIVLIVVAMVAIAVGAWALLREDVAVFEDAGALMEEQQAILAEVALERREFRAKLDDMAKNMRKETSDSTLASKGRAILDMSFVAGKEEALIDQKASRAEKRLAFQSARREAAKKRLRTWGAALGTAELVLLAALFVVPRRFGRARTTPTT